MNENHNCSDVIQHTPIQKFYKDANILITGGTGFLGKLLIEKLLRSCPDINKIFVLVREKRGKSSEERIEDLLKNAIFNNKLHPNTHYKQKIVPINGKFSSNGLEISENDRAKLIESVNIVFHAAATVRFDEQLKLATEINVLGTKDLLELCNQLKHLKSLIHVSTAYSNCYRRDIDEIFYHVDYNYEDLLNLMMNNDDQAIDEVSKKVLNKWPNTYSFTKALAESLIQGSKFDIPVGVFRPSIVISTYKEPIKGWVDNLLGPTAGCVAAFVGFLKTFRGKENYFVDIVPADFCVSAIIASAWDVATRQTKECERDIPIYNYVSSVEKPITWGEFHHISLFYGRKYPVLNAIRHADIKMYENSRLYSLSMFFEHKLPAIIMDTISYLTGKDRRFIKIYNKLEKYCETVDYFAIREWKFGNKNTQLLWQKLDESDKAIFNFNMKCVDWIEYCQSYILGIRTYLIKEEMSTLPEAQKKQIRLYYANKILQTILYFVVVYTVLNILQRIKHYIFNS